MSIARPGSTPGSDTIIKLDNLNEWNRSIIIFLSSMPEHIPIVLYWC